MHSLFDNSTYSDLTVTCEERAWRVHKAIVCLRSRWFANALKHGTKVCSVSDPLRASRQNHTESTQEAGESTIQLQEIQPNIAETVLRYLYTFEYPDSTESGKALKDDKDGGPALIYCVQVHSAADFFGLEHLGDLAAEKFKPLAEAQCGEDIFAEAAELVYASTPAQNDQLRGAVVEIIAGYATKLLTKNVNPQLGTVISSVPALGYNIAKRLSEMTPGSAVADMRRLNCKQCGRLFAVTSPPGFGLHGGNRYYCPHCGSHQLF